MTCQGDLKRIIRERQSKSGESYTAARSYVMRERTVLLGHTDEGRVAVEPLRLDAARAEGEPAVGSGTLPRRNWPDDVPF